MRWFDRLAILFSGGKIYLILFLCITIKINRCCVISLAQYILKYILKQSIRPEIADQPLTQVCVEGFSLMCDEATREEGLQIETTFRREQKLLTESRATHHIGPLIKARATTQQSFCYNSANVLLQLSRALAT